MKSTLNVTMTVIVAAPAIVVTIVVMVIAAATSSAASVVTITAQAAPTIIAMAGISTLGFLTMSFIAATVSIHLSKKVNSENI